MKKFILLICLLFSSLEAKGFPSWYYEIKSVKDRKEKFIQIMVPMIEKENQNIMQERAFVKRFFSKGMFANFSVDESSIDYLSKLAQKYKIKKLYNKNEYLKRINKIPVSLAVAQAALESAWGKSRFVKIANNIFGQWTWSQANGIVPKEREEGKTHMIRNFKTLQNSVSAYMLNLNRNHAYREFRDKRETIANFNGIDASHTMTRYSEIGQEYVRRLIKMIERNNLLRFDTL
jgi:Bax protein